MIVLDKVGVTFTMDGFLCGRCGIETDSLIRDKRGVMVCVDCSENTTYYRGFWKTVLFGKTK